MCFGALSYEKRPSPWQGKGAGDISVHGHRRPRLYRKNMIP